MQLVFVNLWVRHPLPVQKTLRDARVLQRLHLVEVHLLQLHLLQLHGRRREALGTLTWYAPLVFPSATHRRLLGIIVGCQSAAHRLLTGYSSATHRLLIGYSSATHRANSRLPIGD